MAAARALPVVREAAQKDDAEEARHTNEESGANPKGDTAAEDRPLRLPPAYAALLVALRR